MTGCQRGRLVEKEQVGVAVLPDFVTPLFEGENTANPLSRGPATISQRPGVAVKTPAAIAIEQSACRCRDQVAKRIDTVLQRHALLYRAACQGENSARAEE